MPCIEETDLSELAQQHITAQKANISNLRTRLQELELENATLLKQGATVQDARLKEVQGAIRHLRSELNGEVETAPGSMIFRRDPLKRTAEERAEVMESLYTRRKQYIFHDTTKGGEPRTASLFGYPTVEEMIELGYDDIAQEMMTRAASLVQARADGRNPIDFLDADGLDVKQALGNIIEHHHIYNNVHLNAQGRVEFKSFKLYQNSSGELTMNIVPSYWNAAQHGKNTQFIGLLDGMHAGEDPITHLHYYRFGPDEAAAIKAKIRADIGDTIAEAKGRVDRLTDTLGDLEFRRVNPEGYEQGLLDRIAAANTELDERKKAAKGLISKPKSSLAGEQLDLREAYDAKSREIKQLTKKLDEHREIQGLRGAIDETETQIGSLQQQVNNINLSKIPKADRDAKKLEKQELQQQVKQLKTQLKDQKTLLKNKGDIDELITSTRKKLDEATTLADLTPDKAVELFDRQNGFFSFDKGFAEKEAHTVYRPIMNEEIQRLYVRQTIDFLQQRHGDSWAEELQKIAEGQYRNNLMQRLEALIDKVNQPTVAR